MPTRNSELIFAIITFIICTFYFLFKVNIKRFQYDFHSRFLLADFFQASESLIDICHCFVNHCNRFLQLYHPYCQNKAVSEALRRDFVHGLKFFAVSLFYFQ